MINSTCAELHSIIHKGHRFFFKEGYKNIPKNGIYLIFEKGEKAHGGDRIVRVGTHTGNKQLPSRIFQHFENKNKNRSIFRKNIGRCFLNKDKDDYLCKWDLDTTTKRNKEKFSTLINIEYEREIEEKISAYIQANLSFSVIEIATKEERMLLESRLIGTISSCTECKPSKTWLGNCSPVEKIRKSGLWQVMELYKQSLNDNELNIVRHGLIK
jgi:hypothetical protein